MRNRRYEDQNELVAYINDVQHIHNEILENLESLRRHHQRTNDHLPTLEARIEHIDFHMHDHATLFAAPPVIPPNPPPWEAFLIVDVAQFW